MPCYGPGVVTTAHDTEAKVTGRGPDEALLEKIGATPGARIRLRVKRLVILGLVAGTVAAAIFAYIRARRPLPTRYETITVATERLRIEVIATGTLAPRNTIEIGAEISGRVATVDADFNDRVEIGQVLATLDDDALRAAVRQARAQQRAARAALRTAETNETEARSRLARARRLTGQAGLSEQEVEMLAAAAERAEAAIESARAQVEVTTAAVITANENVQRATILAPISGVVLTRAVEPGQTIAAAFAAPVLFVLAEDLEEMELRVDVDEADIGRVRDGLAATFAVDAYPDRTFEATVVSVRNTARQVQNVVTYEAILSVQNADLALRPGMTATARILAEEIEDARVVPNVALRFVPPNADDDEPRTPSARSGQRLFMLRGGVPEPVDVQVGPSDGRKTQILGGDLADDAEIIVDVIREDE